ncbi:MAG: GNAT family N-acetyltransferase [Taibaiella sp.]|nr:GNAT family N-acetyltransferase [Taibaiella sp.]
MTIHIRKAALDDSVHVYRLMCGLEDELLDEGSFRQVYEANLGSAHCFYWVAEAGKEIIGFISLHIQQLLHYCGAVGEIQEFYIDKGFRRKGIGRLLINKVEQCAQARDVKSLEVTSSKKRAENVKVYERLGFKLIHNKFTTCIPVMNEHHSKEYKI